MYFWQQLQVQFTGNFYNFLFIVFLFWIRTISFSLPSGRTHKLKLCSLLSVKFSRGRLAKMLRFMFNKALSWNEHLFMVSGKLSRVLYFIREAVFGPVYLVSIYFVTFYCHISFGFLGGMGHSAK